MKILIIGAAGFLGKYMYSTFKKDETFSVIGTKFSTASHQPLPFDITKDSIKQIAKDDNEQNKAAVINSALSSISMVENNRAFPENFNITSTKKLIDELLALGYKNCVYFVKCCLP